MFYRIVQPLLTHRRLLPGLLLSVSLHAAAFGVLAYFFRHNPLHLGGSHQLQVTLQTAKADANQHQRSPAVPRSHSYLLTRAHSTTDPLPQLAEPTTAPASASEVAMASMAEQNLVAEASYSADYLHNPKPEYPPLSRRLGEQGRVLLAVRVSTEGKALDVSVKESSGYTRLDNAAVNVVRDWQFVPARSGNENLVSTVEVPLQFMLEK